jgi:hypothetical protein
MRRNAQADDDERYEAEADGEVRSQGEQFNRYDNVWAEGGYMLAAHELGLQREL